jgi:rhodanese-related sulfurtransferase
VSVREITVRELSLLLCSPSPPVLLDVRRQDEHAWARIDGAVLIPLDELDSRLDELDPSRPHVVFCHHGIRSLGGAVLLERAGFGDVVSLRGGLEAWSLEVDPKVPRY